MRVLVATDGSKHAELAVRMAAGMEWPAGSEFKIVHVVSDRALTDDRDQLEAAARVLGANGRRVERLLTRHDEAAKGILGVAADWKADVIVLGHRGHGTIASLLLGSVAAEVTENAEVPVLIVRGDRLGPAVLADDGSEPSRAARAVVAEWPALRRLPVHVISVGQVVTPMLIGVAPTMRDEVAADVARDRAAALAEHAAIAQQAGDLLRSRGVEAKTSAVVGDPADAILNAARDDGAALIVVGSRGLHGVAGVLGSVGRAVTLRASCSVLVVHAA